MQTYITCTCKLLVLLYFVYMLAADVCCMLLCKLTWLDSLYLLGDTSSVLSECSASIHPVRQKRVKQRERGEVVKVEMVVAAHQNSR